MCFYLLPLFGIVAALLVLAGYTPTSLAARFQVRTA